MKNPRVYNVSDVDMILAADTIIGHAIANKALLQAKRSVWADPFFEDFRMRINDAIQTYLGADNAKELRLATQKVKDTMAPVRELAGEIKVQIEEDFSENLSRRDEILTTLGFASNAKSIRWGDQQAAMEFLYRFQKNLSIEMIKELTNAGIMESSLLNLADYAEQLKDANVAQEVSKGDRKVMTAEAIAEFNAIYKQLVNIARISSKFFRSDRARQELFSINKTTKALGVARKPQSDTV